MKKNLIVLLIMLSALFVYAAPPSQQVVLWGFVLYPNGTIVNGTAMGGNINVSAYNSTGTYLGTDDISEDAIYAEGRYVIALDADTTGLNEGDNILINITYPNGTVSLPGYTGVATHVNAVGGANGPVNVTLVDIVPPSTVSGFSGVSLPAGSAINLSWIANVDDTFGYFLWRGTTLLANLSSAANTSYLDSGRTDGTEYTYYISAYDITPNFGTNATTSATPADTLAPAQVSGAATVTGNNTINLTWSAVTQNSDTTSLTDLAGYYVYNNLSGSWVLNYTAGPTVTSYYAGYPNLVTYWFMISAFDDNGNAGSNSTAVYATPSERPQITSTVASNSIIKSSVVVNFTISSGTNLDTVNYQVYNSTPVLIASESNSSVATTSWNYVMDKTNWLENDWNQITVWANDTNGENNTAVFNIKTDDTAPSVTEPYIGDEDGIVSFISGTLVYFNVTITDANTIASATFGNLGNDYALTNSSDLYYANVNPSSIDCEAQTVDGTCTVFFNVSDSAGNINDTIQLQFIVDGVSPSVTNPLVYGGLINQVDDLVRENDSLQINISVADTNAISSVLVNGQAMTNLTGSVYNYTGTALTLCGAADGACTLQFNVSDIVGNWNYSTTKTITIDDTVPAINSVSITDDYVQNNTAVIVTVNATDTNNVNSVTAEGTSLAYQAATGLWNGSISLLDETTDAVDVIATDIVGNAATDSTTTYTIDDDAPAINSISLSDSYTQNATDVTLTVNVTDTGINTVIAEGMTLSQNGDIWTGTVTLLDDDLVINVSATDNASNIALDSSTSYTIDDTDPSINSIALADTYVRPDQVVGITVNVTDGYTAGVTANGGALVNTSGDIWVGNLTMPSSSGVVIVVATDAADNTNTANSSYTVDSTSPTFTIAVPSAEGIYSNANGNITFNFTITEANLSVSNVSVDFGQYAYGTTTAGENTVSFTGLQPGEHSAVFTATDEAGNAATPVTRAFTVIAPLNLSKYISDLGAGMSGALLSVNFSRNGSDVSTNETLDINTTLALDIRFNLSGTETTASIPGFSGLEAAWEHVFTGETNESSALGNSLGAIAGTSIKKIIHFTNLSNYLGDSDYDMAVLFFGAVLGDQDVLYIEDDSGSSVYKLSECSSVPTSVASIGAACYINTSTNVTLYLPHFSGGALANDTTAPTVNITVPTNASTQNNSYLTLAFDVWEANPNTNFCMYNLTNSSGDQYGNYAGYLTTPTSVGTKYSFTKALNGLVDGNYGLLVECQDLKNQTTTTNYVMTVTDSVAPVISAVSPASDQSTTSTSLDVTLSATTDEAAACRYAATDINYSTMTLAMAGTGTAHTVSISYTADDAAETYYVLCNDTAGNVMTTASTISYAVDVGSETVTSSSSNNRAPGEDGDDSQDPIEVVRIWEDLVVGKDYELKGNDPGLALESIRFRLAEDASNYKLRLVGLLAKPSIVEDVPNAYKYFNIVGTSAVDTYESITITFVVDSAWLQEKGAEASQVQLMRYVDGQWTELETTVQSQDSIEVKFSAQTPGFSFFAIAVVSKPQIVATPAPTPVPTAQPTPAPTAAPTPEPSAKPVVEPVNMRWISILIAVIAIVGIALLYEFGIRHKYQKDLKEYGVHQPHKETKKLDAYIEKALSQGLSQDKIKSLLMEKGWEENVVDKALKSVFKKS